MTIKQKLQALATEKNTPCVTISFNTHRTYPDNTQDRIRLKNLVKERTERIKKEFDEVAVAPLLEKLSHIESEVDENCNLDSLHIYLSNDTKEIIKSPWPTHKDGVHISDTFDVRSLIKSYNRCEEYFILLLSQGGVTLYEAINNGITSEIQNEDFPFPENPHYATESKQRSESKIMDNYIRQYFNEVDKAVVNMYNKTGLHCVIISTEDNYSRLMQVADRPEIYHGYAHLDYNNSATHQIAQQSWELMKEIQHKQRQEAIHEMREAVGQNSVLTDLEKIYQAAIDGRGDLLIVHQDFSQPVLITSDRTFELVNDTTTLGAIDDITSLIAWEVLSKDGRVIFTTQDEIKDLGNIVLKTRF